MKSKPVAFRPPTGGTASGYNAELLPDVCDIYLKAREAGTLPHQQQPVARQAEILVRGLAKVGIIALVDEATGYQDGLFHRSGNPRFSTPSLAYVMREEV